MDLLKLLHGFVKDVLCISRLLPIWLLLAWVWKAGAVLECFNFSLTQSQSRDQTLKSLFELHRRFFKSGLWWFSSFFSHTPLCARKKCEVRKISFSLRREKDIQFFEKWENSWSPSFSLTWICHQYLWIDTPHAYGRTTLKFWFLMGIFKFSDPMYMGSNVIVHQIQSFP